ncbi:MAG: hypothetical protein AB7H93_04975 [Vicinamibacterales bacterium]
MTRPATAALNRRQFLAAAAVAAAACGRPTESARPAGAAPPSRASLTPALLVDAGGHAVFGAYLGEILAGEGICGLTPVPAGDPPPDSVARAAALVVYGDALSTAWVDAVEAAVRRGATLVAVAPGGALLARFGIEDRGELRGDGVFLPDGADAPALRLHVGGRRWTVPPGATAAATFATPGGASTAPAIVQLTHGSGRVSAWAFDVARNVALIRQGDPNLANANHDALPAIQLIDALAGWIRPDTLTRPDADLYQQRLGALLAAGTGATGPLAMLDYFPGDARSVMVATSDAHGNGAALLEALLRRVEGFGGRLSVYYTPPGTAGWRRTARHARWTLGRLPLVGDRLLSEYGPPAPYVVEGWRARGHEFAPHPRADEGVELESGLAELWEAFATDGYGTDHVSTRTHKILWSGWVATAVAQRRRGVRMNLDAYHLGPALRRADGQWAHGHVIGSGLPLRFVDEAGVIVDCYQQPTQLVDEQIVGVFGGMEGRTAEDAVRVAEAMIDAALHTTPTALCAQFHADGFVGAAERVRAAEILLDGTLSACRSAGIPIWTAARWTAFLDARRAVTVDSRRWDGATGQLTTTLTLDTAADPGVALLLPSDLDGRRLVALTAGGAVVTPTTTTRGGRAWARCPLRPGTTDVVATYRA